MKKAELLLAAVLIFLCCNFNYGQVKEENYKKAVDFFNCKIVEKSLNETVRSSTDAEKPKAQQIFDRFQTESQTCQNTDYKGIQEFFGSDIYPMTRKLSTEINLLKQKYNDQKSADQLVTYLADESFIDNDTFPLLVTFANKSRKVNDFADFKKELKTSLKNIIGAETPPNNPDNSNTSNSNEGPIVPPTVQDSKTPIFLAILALAISVAVFLMFIVEKLSSPNESDKHSSTPWRDSSKKTLAEHTKTLAEHTSDLKKLNNSIQLLITKFDKSENEQLQSKLSPPDNHDNEKGKKQENPKVETRGIFEKTYTDDSAGSTYNIQTQQTATQSSKEVFYFPTPNREGGFNDGDRHSTYTAGKTIYKFSKLSDTRAEFEIDSREDSVRLALTFPDRTIIPVCEIEDSSGNKSRIINVRAGEAILDDQKWNVTKKAVIRYE